MNRKVITTLMVAGALGVSGFIGVSVADAKSKDVKNLEARVLMLETQLAERAQLDAKVVALELQLIQLQGAVERTQTKDSKQLKVLLGTNNTLTGHQKRMDGIVARAELEKKEQDNIAVGLGKVSAKLSALTSRVDNLENKLVGIPTVREYGR